MVFAQHFVTGQQTKLITLVGYWYVLAHKLPDEVEAAYLRGAYLEKRKGEGCIQPEQRRDVILGLNPLLVM